MDKFNQDEKVARNAMSTLLNSTFGSRRSLSSVSPSMRRIEVESARYTEYKSHRFKYLTTKSGRRVESSQ
jgi:hypothetical protein